MKTKALIFDCDGTLVDSLGQALESFNFALTQIGERPRKLDEIKRYFGAAADRILSQVIGDEEKGLRAFEFYLDHQTQLASTMRLHDGIRALLDRAREARIPMAVVTGRHARDLDVVLAPHALGEYFQTLIADSHLPHSKPAPDGILLAAERLKLDVRETAYIGDSAVDMQAARAAGARGVAALWDQLARKDEMTPFAPALLAQTPVEVWQIFG